MRVPTYSRRVLQYNIIYYAYLAASVAVGNCSNYSIDQLLLLFVGSLNLNIKKVHT